MGLRWPGLYFRQFEKHLPQPEIKSTHLIHLEINFNPTLVVFHLILNLLLKISF